jgi:hypothetical protein
VPVPDVPYPRENSTAEFRNKLILARVAATVIIALFVLLVALLLQRLL